MYAIINDITANFATVIELIDDDQDVLDRMAAIAADEAVVHAADGWTIAQRIRVDARAGHLTTEQVIEGAYRAAVWTSDDGQSEVDLTTPEQSSLSDDDLLAAGRARAEETGLKGGAIAIAEWRG